MAKQRETSAFCEKALLLTNIVEACMQEKVSSKVPTIEETYSSTIRFYRACECLENHFSLTHAEASSFQYHGACVGLTPKRTDAPQVELVAVVKLPPESPHRTFARQILESFTSRGSGGFRKLAVSLCSHLFQHRVRRNDESDRCRSEQEDQVNRPETRDRSKPAEIREHHQPESPGCRFASVSAVLALAFD